MKKNSESITQKKFFKGLRRNVPEIIPELRHCDKQSIHMTMTCLRDYSADIVKLSPKRRIERIKQGQEAILMRIGLFLNRCWYSGTYNVMNAVMVSYFESVELETYKALRPYLSTGLDKEAKRYRKWWNSRNKYGKKNGQIKRVANHNKKSLQKNQRPTKQHKEYKEGVTHKKSWKGKEHASCVERIQ